MEVVEQFLAVPAPPGEEEKIDTMIEEKKALADLVGGQGESWLTELSTGDLREVFALSEGAVGE